MANPRFSLAKVSSRATRIVLAVGALILSAGVFLLADWYSGMPEDAKATYVGRQSCVECHQPQHALWEGSHHDRAMDLATPKMVLGNFDNQEVTFHGITSRMTTRDGKFYVTTDNELGEMQEFEVKYVFGFDPLQQYMVEFPDDTRRKPGEIGRLQVLQLCWDTNKERWFHLYSDPVLAGDPVHWTGPSFNWNQTCADCHSTNLRRNFHTKTRSYHTTFSEIDVSCEACHGPGSLHVEMANSKSLFWDRRLGYGLAKLKGEDTQPQLQMCARCHSRRARNLHPDYHAGNSYWDHHGLALIEGDLYHADGQIQDEVYVFGSFMQSRMYREGVRCTDCHDPHTAGRRRDEVSGEPLLGNSLCTRCHVPGKYDSFSHHHHKSQEVEGKDGTLCVNCHMPETLYMQVDLRRDHSIRVPRPDLSVAIGTPNACDSCHKKEKGEGPQWATDAVVKWFGEKRKDDPHWAPIFAKARRGEPDAESGLIVWAQRKKTSPMVRASAVRLLGRYRSEKARHSIATALKDDEVMVRAAAVQAMEEYPAGQFRYEDWHESVLPAWRHPQFNEDRFRIIEWIDDLVPLLSDETRLVRTEAARALSAVPREVLTEKRYEAWQRALDEYIEGFDALGDEGRIHAEKARLCLNRGDTRAARKHLETGLQIQPNMINRRDMLAKIYDSMNLKEAAEKLRRQEVELIARALKREPDAVMARYERGRLLYLLKEYEQAEEELAKVCDAAPDNTLYLTIRGLNLRALERWAEVEKVFARLIELDPRNREYHIKLHEAIRRQRKQ
jgi:tetratricopeptide (TPR) repeat protein/uncharacterized protein with PIN domain